MKNYYKEAIVLALGIIIAAFLLESGIRYTVESRRIVTVKGLATREVAADKVIWPIIYNLVGNNMQTIYSMVQSSNEKIVEFLTSNGIPRDEITVNAASVTDLEANVYSENKHNYRYIAKGVVTVSSGKVSLVRSLTQKQSELLKEGIVIISNDYAHQISYEFTGLNKIKPEMLKEATQNARKAAAQFADDSGSELGKIKNAYQGQFSITNRDANTPFIKEVRVVSTIEYFLKN
jgi:hypothetical protein